MFAQIGQALDSTQPAALGGLNPKHVLAVGESQSAFYLTTFADALQPRTDTFGGIFALIRGGSVHALQADRESRRAMGRTICASAPT